MLAAVSLLRWLAGSRPGGRLTFFASPKKVSKKRRATSVPLTRSLALLAAFGTLANSLRSNNASVLIRTLLRCSARPNGGGIPLGSSASRTSPEWLVRFAHIAGVGVSSLHTPHSTLHTPPVIPGVSAEPKLRHSAHSRGIHASHHARIDAATTRSMTACAGKRCPPSPTPCTRHSAHHPIIPRPYHPIISRLTRNLPKSGCLYLASCTPWRSGTGTARRAPTTSLLTPTTSPLTPWLETFFWGEFFG